MLDKLWLKAVVVTIVTVEFPLPLPIYFQGVIIINVTLLT